jgi:hypothetical protein
MDAFKALKAGSEGEKNLEKGLLEIKKRRTGEIFLVKMEEVISKIQEMITEEMMV